LWMGGVQGSTDSFVEARHRAGLVADQLNELSVQHRGIMVVGQGLINLYVAKALIARGWRGRIRPLRYWEAIALER
jgi:hypothetical protein